MCDDLMTVAAGRRSALSWDLIKRCSTAQRRIQAVATIAPWIEASVDGMKHNKGSDKKPD